MGGGRNGVSCHPLSPTLRASIANATLPVQEAADGVAAGPGGLDEKRREALHPAKDGDMVDVDAPFGQQLLHVPVGQPEAQVPPHPQEDHVGWEPEAGEGR